VRIVVKMDAVCSIIVLLFSVICTSSVADSTSDKKELYCAACEVIMDEISYTISKVDTKKTIEIAGFRVDPQGNQKQKTIPYARSEVHLTEVVENLCSNMNKYAQSRDKVTNKLKFIRTESRDGEAITLENVSLSGEISEKLRYVCENIIEDHEEGIIRYFKKERKDPVKGFCTKKAKLCLEEKEGNDEL